MKSEYKYLILGAGVSGLCLAAKLLEAGETSFLVLEKEGEPGGLCRSAQVDESPLDIGGGHFLDVRRPDVLDFLFTFLPREEWNRFDRKSLIRLGDYEIDYPFESNIWQFPAHVQEEYLASIARAGCNNGLPMPEKFSDWIYWKLGDKIAADYMIPYNEKIWSLDLDRLGTYWLYKLPNVSYEDTLWSCRNKSHKGGIPAHAVFLYPKAYGYGEVWRRIAASLGDKILLDTPVESIDFNTLTVNGTFKAQTVINTVPWPELRHTPGMPEQVAAAIKKLVYASIRVAYRPEDPGTDAHWVYVPDRRTVHHRLVCRKNFCTGGKGYWTETNTRRIDADHVEPDRFFDNPYAYPINTVDKPRAIETVLQWCQSRSVIGLGRWGQWEHVNSDAAVAGALQLADRLLGKD